MLQNYKRILQNVTKLRDQFNAGCTHSPDRFEKSITKVNIMNFSNEILKRLLEVVIIQ